MSDKSQKDMTIEKMTGAGSGLGLIGGLGYTFVFGKIGIAGTFTFGLLPIVPAVIAGTAIGACAGIVLKNKDKIKNLIKPK
ncbi:MAG: hypothetical protein OXJ52_05875 [Oligoflexia bacterium]|nr:hypothetical protein [Oligoflexia bacterium]